MITFQVILFFILFLTMISIVWYTIKTGISPMFSSKKACNTMLSSVLLPKTGSLIDIGSGWGTLVIATAKKHPEQQVIGYELSWLPWFISVIRKQYLGLANLTLYRKNAMNADFSNASVLFCYLFPQGMEMLYHKLQTECCYSLIIVSNNFALPYVAAKNVIKLNDMYQTPIYTYHWPN